MSLDRESKMLFQGLVIWLVFGMIAVFLWSISFLVIQSIAFDFAALLSISSLVSAIAATVLNALAWFFILKALR